jgi:Gp157 protein
MSVNRKEQSLSLWHLTNEHTRLMQDLYDVETGEINDIVQAKLDALEPSIDQKCVAVSKWIRHMESQQRELDGAINDLANRKRAYDKEITKFNRYLQENMERAAVKEISCPYFTIRLRKNPFCTDIIDENAIPEKFMKTREIVKVESKPDKNAIKEEVMRTGQQVPGAFVSQKNKLEILTDKI